MKPEREQTLQDVSSVFLSEEQPANFKHSSLEPTTTDLTFVRKETTGIPVHVEEAMTKLVIITVRNQHEKVNNCLSAACEPLIERVVKMSIDGLK